MTVSVHPPPATGESLYTFPLKPVLLPPAVEVTPYRFPSASSNAAPSGSSPLTADVNICSLKLHSPPETGEISNTVPQPPKVLQLPVSTPPSSVVPKRFPLPSKFSAESGNDPSALVKVCRTVSVQTPAFSESSYATP